MPFTLKPPLLWLRKGLIKLIVGNLTNWTSDSGVFYRFQEEREGWGEVGLWYRQARVGERLAQIIDKMI
jgi:hypothetical protein